MLFIVATTMLFGQTDYEKWKKAEAEKYKQWKDERDKAFSEFLKLEWKKFNAFKEQNLFDSPKPKKLPIAPPKPETKPELKPKAETKPEPKPEPKPETKPDVKPEAKPLPKPELKPEPKPEQKPEPKPELIPAPKPEPKPEPRPEPKPEPKPELKLEPKPDVKPEPKPESKPEPKPELKPEPKPEPKVVVDPKRNPSSVTLDFYEAKVPVQFDDGLNARLSGPPSGKTISEFWETMSRSNYEDYLKQAKAAKERMTLNDWGYCELLNKTAERLAPGSRNQSNLFVWFMLQKSGYQAKIGYSGDKIYLLLPTSNMLYGVPYYMFGTSDTKYYSISFDRSEKPQNVSMYSYEQSYPDATKLTGCRIDDAPSIQNDVQTRTLKFTHNASDYSIKVNFDRSAVKFYEYYPQTNFEVYFGAVPSMEATTTLLNELKPLIQGKSETEAVDFLLHFVQTAFEYKTDDDQFSREKPLFPEETLFYPASDCEDRSILFSYLVRKLLGLEVVGLDYPGHIATAVRFNGNVLGDQVTHQNKKFIICDPTYINADHGMCMPQFKNIKPGIIAMKG